METINTRQLNYGIQGHLYLISVYIKQDQWLEAGGLGKIFVQPPIFTTCTFYDSNSIHARSLCKRVGITVMDV